MDNFISQNGQFQELSVQLQHPLHIYTNKYWNAREKIAKKFIKNCISKLNVNLFPINNVVDLACGDASFGRNLAQFFKASELSCFDVNPLQLAQARKSNLELENITTYESLLDIGKKLLPLPSNTIDIAIMMNAIYYLTNKQKLNLFNEIKRCLRPGGRFIFTIENSLYWRNTHPYFPPLAGLWLYPQKIAEKILIKKGFNKKLYKFRLHHHTSSLTYLQLLHKAKAKHISLILNNALEYDKPLKDHGSLPFPQNKNLCGISISSSKEEILNHFENYKFLSLGDKIYTILAKKMVNHNLKKLAFLSAPRIVYLVQF